VGYDDVSLASLTTPPLTTVRQNCREGARLLVESLVRSIDRKPALSAVLATEIVVRASSQRAQYRTLPSLQAKRRAAAAPSSASGRRGAGRA
jgi:hypothetical protein